MDYYIGQVFENDYPNDAVKWAEEHNAYVLQSGNKFTIVNIVPHVPTEEEIQKLLTDGVQAYMDKTVQVRGYDNIHTACTYATSTDETFKAEGTACVAWRDSVWRKCYSLLAEVKTGTRPVPTLEEVIAELPILDWGVD